MAAQERLATVEAARRLRRAFLRCEALFELLWPDTRLRPSRTTTAGWPALRLGAPSVDANALLWHRLGEKTRSSSASTSATSRSTPTGRGHRHRRRARSRRSASSTCSRHDRPTPSPPTVDEVLDTLEAAPASASSPGRSAPGLAQPCRSGSRHSARRSSSRAAASVEFLKQLLDLARAVRRGRAGARPTARSTSSRCSDPHKGALTQILEEYAPPGPGDHRERRRGDRRHRPARSAGPAGRRASPATARSAASCGSSSRTPACRRPATSTTGPTPTSASTTEVPRPWSRMGPGFGQNRDSTGLTAWLYVGHGCLHLRRRVPDDSGAHLP